MLRYHIATIWLSLHYKYRSRKSRKSKVAPPIFNKFSATLIGNKDNFFERNRRAICAEFGIFPASIGSLWLIKTSLEEKRWLGLCQALCAGLRQGLWTMVCPLLWRCYGYSPPLHINQKPLESIALDEVEEIKDRIPREQRDVIEPRKEEQQKCQPGQPSMCKNGKLASPTSCVLQQGLSNQLQNVREFPEKSSKE